MAEADPTEEVVDDEAAAPIEPPVSEVADADDSATPHDGEDAEDGGGSNHLRSPRVDEEIEDNAEVGLTPRGEDTPVVAKVQPEGGEEAEEVLEEKLAGEEDKKEAPKVFEGAAKIVQRERVVGEEDAAEGDADEVLSPQALLLLKSRAISFLFAPPTRTSHFGGGSPFPKTQVGAEEDKKQQNVEGRAKIVQREKVVGEQDAAEGGAAEVGPYPRRPCF